MLTCFIDYAQLHVHVDDTNVTEVHVDLDASMYKVLVQDDSDLAGTEVEKAKWVLEMVSQNNSFIKF